MAVTRINEPYPTAATIALDLREGSPLKGATAADVVSACVERGLPIRDGRLPREWVPNVYFALARREGLLN